MDSYFDLSVPYDDCDSRKSFVIAACEIIMGFAESELLAVLEDLLVVAEELLASGVSNFMSGSFIPHTFRTSHSLSELDFSDLALLLEPTTSPSIEPRNDFTSEQEGPRSPSMGELSPKPSVELDGGDSNSAVHTPDSISAIELFRTPFSTLRIEETLISKAATIGSTL